jgi:hypothetical protein
MRPNLKLSAPRISLCLVAIGLVLVFGNSGRPEVAAKARPSLKDLQRQRLEVLEQLHGVAANLFQSARIEYEAVLGAERDLLAARLEYADTREDRIKACDETIENAEKSLEIVQARKVAARGLASEALKAQAFLLEAQIAREKLETEK